MVRDMTKGSIMRAIIYFALPMFVGNIFQQIYNMVDTIVVGNFVGSEALAAVGTCTSAFSLLLSLITGLENGMAVIIAQYFGAGNYERVKASFVSAIYVNLAASIGITVVGVLLTRPLLLILDTPENIMTDAVIYLTIMFLGTTARCVYNGVSSVLRALGNSVIPLVILIICSVLNVILDLVLVIVFGMGVAGVAIATIAAELISAVLCMIYAFATVPILRFTRSEFRPEGELVKEIVRIGVPAAVSSSGVSISQMFLQRAINAYGSTVIAAFTIGNRAEQLGLGLSYSIGAAVGTFCGQNIGARDFDRVKKGLHAGYKICFAYTFTAGALLFILAAQLSRLFSSDPEVIAIAVRYVRVLAIFGPVLGLVFLFQNFLRCAGDITPTVWMSVSEIVARSVLAYIFSALFGYYGICWATPIGWSGSALIGYLRYRTGKWKEKSQIKSAQQTG